MRVKKSWRRRDRQIARLEGLRSGNLNAALAQAPVSATGVQVGNEM